MIDASLRRPIPTVDRSTDRLVALGAIAISLGYLIAAVASVALPAAVRGGAWLPLHLALAGGATTVISGVMPFFVAAFAAAPPADHRLRWAAVLLVAIGAGLVAIGVPSGVPVVTVAGGSAFIAGVGLTASAALRPVGRGLGPGRGIVTRGYVAALVNVALGAGLATLFVAGWQPLLEAWGRGRGAHAWLNLIGFVSLVIATTLLHFFPTVIGARIAAGPAARATIAGLAMGAPTVALGLLLEAGIAARVGAGLSLIGGLALAFYAGARWRTRARWTTDRDWHRFAMGGLVSAISWFQVGLTVAAARVLVAGAGPTAWSVDVAGPALIAGWMGIAVLASATHLVPAIGPGSPAAHARQRAMLGRGALARLLAANVGVAVLTFGPLLDVQRSAEVGIVLVAVALLSSAALLAWAVVIGLRERPR